MNKIDRQPARPYPVHGRRTTVTVYQKNGVIGTHWSGPASHLIALNEWQCTHWCRSVFPYSLTTPSVAVVSTISIDLNLMRQQSSSLFIDTAHISRADKQLTDSVSEQTNITNIPETKLGALASNISVFSASSFMPSRFRL